MITNWILGSDKIFTKTNPPNKIADKPGQVVSKQP